MATDPAAEPAPAKVNLYLHIVGKRPDGYHLLDSLAVFAAVADRVSYAPAADLTLRLTGPFAGSLAAEPDNLVLRAARGLAERAGIAPSGALTLDKHIPVASGVGGGSADAAATLRLLCRVWNVALAPDSLAIRLGADVPVCLRARPARMTGIGEILSPAPALPSCGLLLVNPGVPVATPDVFRARQGEGSGGFSTAPDLPAGWDSAAAMAETLRGLTNDLEAPAIRIAPVIGDVLTRIAATPGCLLARMSGSGATCFGLYASATAAEAAASALAATGWWCHGGALRA